MKTETINGAKRFLPSEYLNARQIASAFHRLAASHRRLKTQLEENITDKLRETDISEVSRDAEETDYRKEPLFDDEFDVIIYAVLENKQTLFSDGSDRQSQDTVKETNSNQVHDELF
jgi:hypothetical protein